MKIRKILALILSIVMVLGTVGTSVWADTTSSEDIPLPTATVTEIENDELTFALNFLADEATEAQLEKYGKWYADFVLTVNKEVTFNANGDADGYLSGQYDGWSENWLNVPFEDVTLNANEPLKIMEYAAKMMGQSGLKITYNDVYEGVKDFDCGVYFTEEFLNANSDFKVTLALRMFNPEDESESYIIGIEYVYTSSMVYEAYIGERGFVTLEDAIAAIESEDMTGDVVVNLAAKTIELENPITITEKDGRNITISGATGAASEIALLAEEETANLTTIKGQIIIDGLANQYTNCKTTIKNIDFDATDLAADSVIISAGVKGDTLTRYIDNLTVSNCSFTGDDKTIVAIKPTENGSTNWKIENCTASGIHSLLQIATNVVGGLEVSGCTVTDCKNGLNIGNSEKVTVTNNDISVSGYALRVGSNSVNNKEDEITITGNSFTSSATNITDAAKDVDAPVIIRKSVDYGTINMTNNAIVSTGHGVGVFAGEMTTEQVASLELDADENYWGGNAPVMYMGTATAEGETVYVTVGVNSYYETYEENEDGELEFGGIVEDIANVKDEAELKAALLDAQGGETIVLLNDIELATAVSFAKNITVTIDGSGYTIKPAANSTEANSAFNMGQGNDDTRANRKYNFKNIVFDGWTTIHVVRLQGTTTVIDNCTFINIDQTSRANNFHGGIVTSNFADVTVKNSTFKDNKALKCIDVNYNGDDSLSKNVIENCVFQNNNVNAIGVIYYSEGGSIAVTNNEFVGNTVNTTGNAATLYLGFNANHTVTGNIFEGNSVNTSHETTARIAGAIFAGNEGTISGNAFIDNVATRNGDVENLATGICYAAYYAAGDLSGNYWDGKAPTVGNGLAIEYRNRNPVVINNYYTSYSVDEDGNLVLGEEDKAEMTPVIASAGAKEYISINDAIEYAMASGNEIVLTGDVKENIVVGSAVSAFALRASNSVVLDLGGYTLSPADADEPVITVSAANLTIKNGTVYGDISVQNGGSVTVEGGKFYGELKAYDESTVVLYGGYYKIMPDSDYVADDYAVGNVVNDWYKVVRPVTVQFNQVYDDNNKKVEGAWDIVLATAPGVANEFVSAELILDSDESRVEGGYNSERMHYDVYGREDGKTSVVKNIGSPDNNPDKNVQVYAIHTVDGVDKINLSGAYVTIGRVQFAGKGTPNLKVLEGSRVVLTEEGTYDEAVYTAELDDEGEDIGTLYVGAGLNDTLATTKRDVKVNIEFEHDINANVSADYKYMTVTLKDSIGNTFTKELDDINIKGVNSGEVVFDDVTIGVITVTLKAPGFRTYTYQTTMEDVDAEFVLDFWNSVKRDSEEYYIEEELKKGKGVHNFLVGDIAMDYIIDKYDLAAVTSYYGIYDINDSTDTKYIEKLVKYDLNRDGDIDILDVAYVLHGMGN